MSLESDEKAFKKGLEIWQPEDVLIRSEFEKWVCNQDISVLEFTHDVFLKCGWTHMCGYIKNIISLKKINDINEPLGININDQLN